MKETPYILIKSTSVISLSTNGRIVLNAIPLSSTAHGDRDETTIFKNLLPDFTGRKHKQYQALTACCASGMIKLSKSA